MDKLSKTAALTLLLIITISASSLLTAQFVSAQSTAKPATPKFTAELVERVIDEAPTYTTDPYSGETVAKTNGYHTSYWIVKIKIENTIPNLFYNYRVKGHFSDVWAVCPLTENGEGVWTTREYSPFDLTIHPTYAQATSSEYTEVQVEMQSLKPGNQVDVQVQAISGTIDNAPNGGYQILTGQGSDWSNTQTLTVPGATPMPTENPSTANPSNTLPTTPETNATIDWQVIAAILAVAVIGLAAALAVVLRRRANH